MDDDDLHALKSKLAQTLSIIPTTTQPDTSALIQKAQAYITQIDNMVQTEKQKSLLTKSKNTFNIQDEEKFVIEVKTALRSIKSKMQRSMDLASLRTRLLDSATPPLDDAVLHTGSKKEQLLDVISKLNLEIEKTQKTSVMLAETYKNLSGVVKRYERTAGTVEVGRKIISKLGSKDFVDRMVLIASFVLFLSVVVYIVRQRLGF